MRDEKKASAFVQILNRCHLPTTTMAAREASPASLRQTIEGAQKLGLCPNRIWQSGARLADWRTALSEYLPDFCKTLPDGAIAHEDHLRCTLDSCEFSSRNFTAVLQYHEPYPYETGSQIAIDEHHADPSVCFAVRGLFDDGTLVKAVKAGTPTAWTFGGLATLARPRPYMAISHVWSDGTGLGPWPSKQVPSCLYDYFCTMADIFGCEGLWWDTLCVPQDREARGEALRIMDQNYARARLTLVHDRFLRALPFQGPDKACFALIMSTWFTRGWTALELARSRRVKVVFADAVYDLDHDILGRAAKHNAAAKIIRHLRDAFDGQHSIDLDELLSTLAPRHTSWAKDRAVIAGLLASIPLIPNQDRELWQRDIYQDILRSIGKVSHGHLFHRSATMSDGFAWCPMDIFELPQSSASPVLSVKKSGALQGTWEVATLDDENVRGEVSEKAVWEIRHTLLEETVRKVIVNDWKDHVLLLDPEQVTREDHGGGSNVRNAVIAKVMDGADEEPDLLICQYVGSLDFHSAIQVETSTSKNVTIGGTKGCAEPTLQTDLVGTNKTAQSQDLETQPGPSEKQVLPTTDGSQQYSHKDLRLHLAGERRETKTVESMLSLSDDPAEELTRRDNDGHTPLHRAAWGGCVDTVRVMLSHGSSIHAKDKRGRTALHLAADQGFEHVVSCLCGQAATLGVELLNATTERGLTALHCATLNGHYEVVKFILSVAGADIDAAENIFRWTPLHIAADIGHAPIFQLLVDAGAKVEQRDVVGWTALHLAAMSGHISITKLVLLQKHTELISREDSQGWLPIHFALINGHKRVVDELYELGDKSWDLAMPLALLSLSTQKETLDPSDLKRVARWQKNSRSHGTSPFT
jgi:ankyrin repeat protein